MTEQLSRREMIAGSGACLVAAATLRPVAAAAAEEKPQGESFRYCLNTGTIMGHKLAIDEEVAVAAKAGYSGVEPWLRNVQRYVDDGHSLADLKKRIADLGLTVESAIGFPAWAVDDEEKRAEGMKQMERDMDLVAQIGGRRIAAPPAGIYDKSGLDLGKIAERYRAVLELGRKMGVVPQLEIWGGAKTLGRVGEAACVAIQADHPDACLLLDAFHMYKGGSGFRGLRLLNGAALNVFHMNDYPADPPREAITDAHRVYPGDGVAPLPALLRDLHAAGFRGALSLELFNRDYWKQDALVVAKTGLAKLLAVVQKARSKDEG